MIYTIGHGNRTWTDFSMLVKGHTGKYLIDVRSQPYSKFNGDFNRDSLESLCKVEGIKYLFMGDSLGGKPKNKRLYDHDGRADYNLIKRDVEFCSSIDRLIKASHLSDNVFVMCSELCPSQCHRSKLIGRTLVEVGIEPIHIDKNGREVSQDEVIRMITKGQGDFFGDDPALTKSRGSYV